jgi:hypothetical protein
MGETKPAPALTCKSANGQEWPKRITCSSAGNLGMISFTYSVSPINVLAFSVGLLNIFISEYISEKRYRGCRTSSGLPVLCIFSKPAAAHHLI